MSAQPTDRRATPDLTPLALPGGGFAMLAIDQRISLETMFAAAGRPVTIDALDDFRADVLGALAPHASAVLVERGMVERGRLPDLGGPPPGRILAAEHLIQERGHPASGSTLDTDAPAVADRLGAHALKLMAIHPLGEPIEPLVELVTAFVAMAHAAGRLAVTEGIVRGAEVTPEAFLAATEALAVGADLYKAQTPIFGGTDGASITALSRELSATLACPWVVLSTGVAEDAFPAAVAGACQGGASGFLAGRGIWASAIPSPDPGAALRGPALGRLTALRAIVEAEARPWSEAAAARA